MERNHVRKLRANDAQMIPIGLKFETFWFRPIRIICASFSNEKIEHARLFAQRFRAQKATFLCSMWTDKSDCVTFSCALRFICARCKRGFNKPHDQMIRYVFTKSCGRIICTMVTLFIIKQISQIHAIEMLERLLTYLVFDCIYNNVTFFSYTIYLY
jgi:hypothetical protein